MATPTTDFAFLFGIGGYTYGDKISTVDDMPMFRPVSGELSGMHGAYQGVSYLSERRLELAGTITGTSQENARDQWDQFLEYHQPGHPRMIVVQGNRWLWGSVDGNVTRKITNLRRIDWSLVLSCGDPFYYKNDLKSDPIWIFVYGFPIR